MDHLTMVPLVSPGTSQLGTGSYGAGSGQEGLRDTMLPDP